MMPSAFRQILHSRQFLLKTRQLPTKYLHLAPQQRGIHGVVIGENAAGSVGGNPVGRAPMDFSKARIGQAIDAPYELTIDNGWVAMWQSCFFQHDRIFTSDPFAQNIGLEEKLLPFSMMMFECASMSHVDEVLEVLELGLENAIYLRPAYVGDTFTKQFFVKAIRPSNSDKGTVVTLKCELTNQNSEVVFTLDKVMWYPYLVDKLQAQGTASPKPSLAKPTIKRLDADMDKRVLLQKIMENMKMFSSSSSLAHIKSNQLILHTFNRALGLQNSINLNTLFRQGHPLLFNTARYAESEIVLPGCLSFALTSASASRALFEIVYEEVVSCRFVERVSPSSPMGAVSYITEINDFNGLEEITLVTLGISDMDVHLELQDVDLPEELFTGNLRIPELRAIIKEKCPLLEGKLALHTVRKLVRQAPFNQIQNIPLL